jgi:hypothetical protein
VARTNNAHVPDTNPEANPLREFWAFVKDFNSAYAAIAKFAVAIPLIDLVLNLGPPWPERIANTTAVVLLQILVLMCSFVIWRQGTGKLYHIKAWLLGSAIAFAVLFLFLYIPLFANFIEDWPDRWNRVVCGYEYNPAIKKLVETDPVMWTPRTLVQYFMDATHDETSIWTAGSVKTMRSVLLIVWLCVNSAYAIAVSAFVALQYRRLK